MVTDMVGSAMKRIFSKKNKNITVELNRIPTLESIDVISWENNKGVTTYNLSYAELGERYMFSDNLLEEVFTEYILDGRYTREKLTDYIDLDSAIRYDYARSHHMEKDCKQILANLSDIMNAPKEKDKVLGLNRH